MANRLFDSLDELETLGRVFDSQLDDVRLNPFAVHVTQFPIDLYETRNEFFVHAYLPGVARDKVEVSLEGNQLTITAERELPRHEDVTWLHVESPRGVYRRTVSLGSGIQGDRIEAAWREGMLVVRIPKVEQARTKVIPIREELGANQPSPITDGDA